MFSCVVLNKPATKLAVSRLSKAPFSPFRKTSRGFVSRSDREEITSSYFSLLDESLSKNSLRWTQSIHCRLIELGLHRRTRFGSRLSLLYYQFGETNDGFKAVGDVSHWDMVSWNILLGELVRNGELEKAREVFDGMPQRDVVSWNSIISGFSRNCEPGKTTELIMEMWKTGIRPTGFTLSIIVSVCVFNVPHGKQVHACMLRNCLNDNLILNNAMICMYGKFGLASYAFDLFCFMEEWDMVSWNATIWSFVKSSNVVHSLTLFNSMRSLGFDPDHFTMSTLVSACASSVNLVVGHVIFGLCITAGFLSNSFVSGAIIDMFAKCNRLDDSIKVFSETPIRDIAIFNSMISTFARVGFGEDAFSLLVYAMKENKRPTEFTFGSVLSCTAWLASTESGRQLHSLVLKMGLGEDFVVSSALVVMYANSGCVDHARQIFVNMHSRDLVSWNAMIWGYARNGQAYMALKLFQEMCSENISPDKITVAGVLSACNHGGLVEQGRQLFSCMNTEYGITLGLEHYTCMVDMLGRAGRIKESIEIIRFMPYEPTALIWALFLQACRLHGDIGITEKVARKLTELEPTEPLPYIVLAQVYAMKAQWESVVLTKRMLNEKCVKKVIGWSWIGIKENVVVFNANHMIYPDTIGLDRILRLLIWEMQWKGYRPMEYAIGDEGGD